MVDGEILGGAECSVVLSGRTFRVAEPVRRVSRRILRDIMPVFEMLPKDDKGNISTAGGAIAISALVAVDDFLVEHLPQLIHEPAATVVAAVENAEFMEAVNAFAAVAKLVSSPFVNSTATPRTT